MVVLDTIACGSYGECTYAEIAQKLENISRNNKAWSYRKSDTRRNTFVEQATQNDSTYEIRERMTQMNTELGSLLKHVTRGAEKVNVVNYFAKPTPPADEYYYEEDTYTVKDQTGSFPSNAQGSNQENQFQGQGNRGQNSGNCNKEGHYVRDENYNHDKTFNQGHNGKRNDQSGSYVPPQNWEVAPRNG